MPPTPNNTPDRPDAEIVRTLRTVAHMTGSFMGANIAAYYSATAHLQGHGTQSFAFGVVGLVPVGYGLWYAIENQTQEFTFYEPEYFLDPDIDTGTNPTASNHTGPPAAQIERPRREAIATGSFDAVRNETTQPTTDVAVSSDSFNGTRDIPLAASLQPQHTPQPAIGNYLTKALPLINRTIGLAFANLSTTIGTIAIIALLTLGLFA